MGTSSSNIKDSSINSFNSNEQNSDSQRFESYEQRPHSDSEMSRSSVQKKDQNSIYYPFEFLNEPENKKLTHNLLLYTLLHNPDGNFFVSQTPTEREGVYTEYISTSDPIALVYKKGMKPQHDFNKDKFFILIDGEFHVYCLIDGHGPFGDLVGQICQDIIFNTIRNSYNTNFEISYEEFFLELFSNIQRDLVNKQVKLREDYDAILSGLSISLIIFKNDTIYTANVGNVLGLLIHSDKEYLTRFEVNILTVDDSDLINDNFERAKKYNGEDCDIANIHGIFDMRDEVRRIYENGGEIRQIAKEEKGRIFVKGKYYPGVINTRSLGDELGGIIGVLPKPHIGKIKLKREFNYYLLMCTDGIGNFFDYEKVANAILYYDNCKFFFNFFSLDGRNQSTR